MYEIIMIDGSKHYVNDVTVFDMLGSKYLRCYDGTYVNINNIVFAVYKK